MPRPTYDLTRFVDAHQRVYEEALRELRNGRKTGHWMWYTFPQLAGLGTSDTSRFYAISSRDEARAYIDHPVLGARLRECTALVLDHRGRSLEDIFGPIDAIKFCSSMTLFALAAPEVAIFRRAIDAFCGGRLDDITVRLLNSTPPVPPGAAVGPL